MLNAVEHQQQLIRNLLGPPENSVVPAPSHKVIGLRSEEKLHDIMVPQDDARSTVELEDRYVILLAHEHQLKP